ncbi:Spermidine/putrescine import ATP-binding protein PotA [bacterium HR40]|nr:Spermidine/putrescine import ATP-binding protein PotA [bacterium HR40]
MRFDRLVAVEPTDLDIRAGEFFSLLGPSGCGKTTLLRLISGFLKPTTGRILIGGRDMAGIPPSRRPTALIFQNLALFPLMSVWENVAFGLEARGVAKAERRRRAEALLELVALAGSADKKPAELSGGQRQRVAIARALAVEPSVLLLDEPLSALDLKLRQHMRHELRAIQRRVGITFVYITHDQGEALTMSDRVAVMRRGRIEQVDTPERLYEEPATAFVATFVGGSNLVPARVRRKAGTECLAETPLGNFRARNPQDLAEGAEGLLFVRPERLRPAAGHDNRIRGRVVERAFEGPFLLFTIETSQGQRLQVQWLNEGDVHALAAEVEVGFSAGDARILPPGPLADER